MRTRSPLNSYPRFFRFDSGRAFALLGKMAQSGFEIRVVHRCSPKNFVEEAFSMLRTALLLLATVFAKTGSLVPELKRLCVAVSPGEGKTGAALLWFDVAAK